jgi:hypothetical protein
MVKSKLDVVGILKAIFIFFSLILWEKLLIVVILLLFDSLKKMKIALSIPTTSSLDLTMRVTQMTCLMDKTP